MVNKTLIPIQVNQSADVGSKESAVYTRNILQSLSTGKLSVELSQSRLIDGRLVSCNMN